VSLPSQSPAGQVPPEEQTQPEEIEGPETVEKLPKPEPFQLDKMGMPDKDKMKGHTVKYDGRNYILDWDAEFQVYKLVDPDTMMVKTRVKPSQVSTIDFRMQESVNEAINSLLSGEALKSTIDDLLEATWRERLKKTGRRILDIAKRHPKKLGALGALGAVGAGLGYWSYKRGQDVDIAPHPIEERWYTFWDGLAQQVLKDETLSEYVMGRGKGAAKLKAKGKVGIFLKKWLGITKPGKILDQVWTAFEDSAGDNSWKKAIKAGPASKQGNVTKQGKVAAAEMKKMFNEVLDARGIGRKAPETKTRIPSNLTGPGKHKALAKWYVEGITQGWHIETLADMYNEKHALTGRAAITGDDFKAMFTLSLESDYMSDLMSRGGRGPGSESEERRALQQTKKMVRKKSKREKKRKKKYGVE